MSRFRHEYRLTPRFGSDNHCWICIGAKGATHLHISGPYMYPNEAGGPNEEHWSAGLETHYRSPPPYMADQAPSHDECWVIKGPCWHDGTSLCAQESYLPQWMNNPHDHKGIFNRLEVEYARRFEEKQDVEDVLRASGIDIDDLARELFRRIELLRNPVPLLTKGPKDDEPFP